MYKWAVWLTMLVIGALLIAAGFQGRPGSLLAAIFTPSALNTAADQTAADLQPAASASQQAAPVQTL